MKTRRILKKYTRHIIVDANMIVPDLSKDPYFAKKSEEMKEFLKHHPTPGMIEQQRKK